MNRRNKGRNKRPPWARKNDNKNETHKQHTESESAPTESVSDSNDYNKLRNNESRNQRVMVPDISCSKCQHNGHDPLKTPSESQCQCNCACDNTENNILSLPDDVLYIIFSFLDHRDLCRLCRVCKRFNYISSKDCVWLSHVEQMVLVQFPQIRRNCSLKERYRIAPNWKEGKFRNQFVTKHKIRQIPWIQKDGQDLWFSSGNVIRCFRCQPPSVKEDTRKRLFGLEQDVTRFVVKKDMVVAGSSDGSIHGWRTSGEALFNHKQLHQNDIHCVDFTDRCVISGSKDGTCKVTPLQTQDSSDSLNVKSFNAGERVWCLQCSPCQSFFVAGLAGCLDYPPLIKWDIESGEFLGHLSSNTWRGAGVLHMKFESANELLTCGYDTFIRLWDLRTNTCVVQWEEPYDSSLYCLETDGANAMAVGTDRHGMVRLWDKRQTEPVQMYYSTSCSSPVYSLAMDYGHLYLALDLGLNVMDFTG